MMTSKMNLSIAAPSSDEMDDTGDILMEAIQDPPPQPQLSFMNGLMSPSHHHHHPQQQQLHTNITITAPAASPSSRSSLPSSSPSSSTASSLRASPTALTPGDTLDRHPSPVLEFDSKKAKMDYFAMDCTAITDYLFVGGKKVAASQEKLKEKGITHIINCCGDVCENYFPDSFHYLKLHLLDSASEDIMCVLYKVIDFIDAVRKGKNKVLVHCQQGVSRSTVLVIAYLMYHEDRDYDSIYEFVRARRGICRPNVGFVCQLLAWRKRVTKGSSRPHCLYRIGPHNPRDRSLVTKWVDRIEYSSLDSRTLFLLQVNGSHSNNSNNNNNHNQTTGPSPSPVSSTSSTSVTLTPMNNFASAASSFHVPPSALAATPAASPTSSTPSSPSNSIIYIWVGNLCPRSAEKQYLPYLAHLIAKLQLNEHASKHVVVIRQKGRDKIEKAEHAAQQFANNANNSHPHSTASSRGPSPKVPLATLSMRSGLITTGSLSPSTHLTSGISKPSSPTAEQSFSSELISASFHTLEAAPAILSATSLSNLYPSASAKETSLFYRVMGLEESEDYTRVGLDCSHAISGAILLNEAMDEDYAEIAIPDIHALNEVAWRTSPVSPLSPTSHGGGKPWLVPPIVQVSPSRRTPAQPSVGPDGMVTDGASPPDLPDEDMSDESTQDMMMDLSDFAKRFNRTPRTSITKHDPNAPKLTLPFLRKSPSATYESSGITFVDGAGEGDPSSPHPMMTLPKRLFVGTPRSNHATPRGSITSPVAAFARPRLSLGLSRLPPEDAMEEMETIPVMTGPISSPIHNTSLLSTASIPGGDDFSLQNQSLSPMMSPSHHTRTLSSSPFSTRDPASPITQAAPYALFLFPKFDSGPIANFTPASLVSPNIYLLHHAPSQTLYVWFPPPPNMLFIPSKYDGDREAFTGDIARIFQIATQAEVEHVLIEVGRKESPEFWQGFNRQ